MMNRAKFLATLSSLPFLSFIGKGNSVHKAVMPPHEYSPISKVGNITLIDDARSPVELRFALLDVTPWPMFKGQLVTDKFAMVTIPERSVGPDRQALFDLSHKHYKSLGLFTLQYNKSKWEIREHFTSYGECTLATYPSNYRGEFRGDVNKSRLAALIEADRFQPEIQLIAKDEIYKLLNSDTYSYKKKYESVEFIGCTIAPPYDNSDIFLNGCSSEI